jgi:hypothetical protein
MPRLLYAREIIDLISQLAQMQERAAEIANSESGDQLKNCLEDLEHSLDTLRACVGALKYRVGLHTVAAFEATQNVENNGEA